MRGKLTEIETVEVEALTEKIIFNFFKVKVLGGMRAKEVSSNISNTNVMLSCSINCTVIKFVNDIQVHMTILFLFTVFWAAEDKCIDMLYFI